MKLKVIRNVKVSGTLSSELFEQLQVVSDNESSAEILSKWKDTYIYRKNLYKTSGHLSVLKKVPHVKSQLWISLVLDIKLNFAY